jgi:hypothetical protein
MSSPRETPLNELNLLLDDLCRDLGFCSRQSAAVLFGSQSVIGATDFAAAVLRAEQMIPEYEPNWSRQLADRFTTRFGPAIRLTD